MSPETGAAGFPSGEWFDLLSMAMRDDRELGVIGHGLSLDLGLRCGEDTYLLRLRGGCLPEVEPVRNDSEDSPDFVLSAPLEAWQKFLRAEPQPFHNHPLAMASRVPGASLDGDLTVFVQHLRALNRMFELARAVENGRV